MGKPSDQRQRKILQRILTAFRRIGRYRLETLDINREGETKISSPLPFNRAPGSTNMKEKSLLIAIDMDGTITKQAFPEIGEPLPSAFEVMKELQSAGHRLMLWSCREDAGFNSKHHNLKKAIEFCRQNGIEFVSVNENVVEGFPPLKGRKIHADVYIDDRNLGGFPGWGAVRELILGPSTRLLNYTNGAGENYPHNAKKFFPSGLAIDSALLKRNGQDIPAALSHVRATKDENLPQSGVAFCQNQATRTGFGRRTRIVATLGPATDRPGVLEAMVKAGIDVARINLSHGGAEENCRRVARLRQISRLLARPVAVLADLPGPKIRAILPGPLQLETGQEVTIAAVADITADINVTEPEPIQYVRPGQLILLDDGRLEFEAVRMDKNRLVARVIVGGTLLPKKGINLPDSPLTNSALTARDREMLGVAAVAGVDFLALSFVRGAVAAEELRAAASAQGLEVPLLAKIERPEAVEHAREIIEAFDGIMMDRGDLGVETSLECVPFVQKQLIALTRAAGKPFITATDMLDSMRTNPRPTRAESSDVANAIYDGTDAVMLSGETAAGKYPVEAVAFLDRIARETEAHLADDGGWDISMPQGQLKDRITHLTCTLAREVGADVIIAPTHTGLTPRLVARHRPRALIAAPTPHESVARQLALVWGVVPVPVAGPAKTGEDWLEVAVHATFVHGVVKEGALAVGVAGHLTEGGKKAPTIRVVRVGRGGASCAP